MRDDGLDPQLWGPPPTPWSWAWSWIVFWYRNILSMLQYRNIKRHKLLVGFIAVMIFLFGTITVATMWLSPDARALSQLWW